MKTLWKLNVVSMVCAIIFISFLYVQTSNLFTQVPFLIVLGAMITGGIYYLIKNYLNRHAMIEWIPLLCLPYTIIFSFLLSKVNPLTEISILLSMSFIIFPIYLFMIIIIVQRKSSY